MIRCPLRCRVVVTVYLRVQQTIIILGFQAARTLSRGASVPALAQIPAAEAAGKGAQRQMPSGERLQQVSPGACSSGRLAARVAVAARLFGRSGSHSAAYLLSCEKSLCFLCPLDGKQFNLYE